MSLRHTSYRKRQRGGGRTGAGLMLRVTLVMALLLAAFLPLVPPQARAALPVPVNVPVGSSPNAIAVNEQTNKIYVSNYGSHNVTVIDGTTNAVLATIPVGDSPAAMAIDSSTHTVYVANSFDGSVSVIDGETDKLTTTIPVSGFPTKLAVDSSAHTVYVAHYSDDTVKLIDGVTQSVTATVSISGTINAIAVNDATNKAYVASSDGSVTIIGANRQKTVVNVGNKPVAIGINKMTKQIYVAIDKSGNGEVKVIDSDTDEVTATLTAGSGPTAVAVNEQTNTVYVTNQGSASLTVIDGATNTATVSLALGSGPVAAAVDADANIVYIAHNSSYSMSVVDGATLEVGTVDTESASQVIAVNALTHKVYVLNASGRKVAVFYTQEDKIPPAVSFGKNGSSVPAPFVSTTVTVTDQESGVNEGWLSYTWSQNEDQPGPTDNWSYFVNGSEVAINVGNPNGTYYLYINAIDIAGNSTTVRSGSFLLDSSGPSIDATMTISGGIPYADNTWSNQDVAMSVAAADANGVTAVTYSLDGGTTWETYTAPVIFHEDGSNDVVIKATDTMGNETIEHRTVQIDQTAPVITLVGPSSIRMTEGGTYTEAGATATDAGGSGVAGAVVVSGSVNPAVPGKYSVSYNVSDLAGNAAEEVTRAVIVDAQIAPITPVVAVKPVIDLNGAPYDPANIDTAKPSVTLEATQKDGAAYVSMPASVLTSIASKNAAFVIEIKTPYGSYRLPINLASLIPGLEELLAKHNLKAEDVSFKITLTDKSGDKTLQAAFSSGLPNGKVMGAMVDYLLEIVNTKTGQTVGAADQFSQAITRIIPMPENVTAMPAQWGAFRYNETTKKFEFVPAKVTQIDGTWYVTINSYSNSAYVVVDNAASFADVQEHWAKADVELAAAKGLVAGVGGGRYDPNRVVTRAEFAAMLVRAMGRGVSGERAAQASYNDVKQGAWYAEEVAAAKAHGLLGFASGRDFKPNEPLTREEMASMLAAAIRLEQPKLAVGGTRMDGYKDIGSANPAYVDSIRLVMELQIMNGTRGNTFSPESSATRAQAATVFIRLLRQLDMID